MTILDRVTELAPRLPEPLIRRVHSRASLRNALYRYVDWTDRLRARDAPAVVPPASLRFRVHGDLDLESFLATGRQCSQDLQAALGEVGRDIDSFERILDFGCGCGRTLQWLPRIDSSISVHGTDIDEEAITWCRRAIKCAAFSVNGELPPLDYPDGYFGLVYAVSVFTHLTEDRQLAWLNELRRVTAQDGFVVITVRGSSYASQLSSRESDELRTRGFVFSQMPPHFQQLFPSWYQTATLTEQYIRNTWSAYLNVVRHLPQALDGCQDIVLLRKP